MEGVGGERVIDGCTEGSEMGLAVLNELVKMIPIKKNKRIRVMRMALIIYVIFMKK